MKRGDDRILQTKFLPFLADSLYVWLQLRYLLMFVLTYELLLPAIGWTWEGPEDNKPAAELQAMDEPTLAWEAQGPCLKASLTSLVVTGDTLAKRKEAQRYLASIIAVRRKQDGKVPPWLYQLAAQAEKGSLQGCHDVAQKIYLPPEPQTEGQDQQMETKDMQKQGASKAKK
ncbi:MAG TPA: hypothetical protein VNN62_20220 [Methylomirabilota bacterium]|nr:hypothetical protein [Methylomirabilota bacterium]